MVSKIPIVSGLPREGAINTAAGRRVGYLDRGPRSGHPVLYLHGMPGCRREQLAFRDEVLERFNLRLVSLDRPGWGQTDALPGSRAERVSDVLPACDELGIANFTLMAVSAGGSYAVTLAATTERVDRLVLVSAQMPYDDAAAIQGLQPDQLAMLPAASFGRIEPVIAGCEDFRQRILADPVAGMAPMMATLSAPERAFADQARVRALTADGWSEGLRAGVDGVVDDFLIWPQPLEVDLADVRCPVRAVHGTEDDWEPLPNLRRILRQIHDQRLVLLDGMNHWGPFLYPDLVMSLAAGE